MCLYAAGMYIQKGEQREIQKSPLAKKLFAITGVRGIFLGKDFVTGLLGPIPNLLLLISMVSDENKPEISCFHAT
jgi:hypothetical protein